MESMRRGLVTLAAVLSLAACGGGRSTTAATPEVTGWEGPPRPDAAGRVPVGDFNVFLAGSGRRWARSPLAATGVFLALESREATPTTVVMSVRPDGGRRARVTVTFDGLLDDSVRAERYVLRFRRSDDLTWRLASARRTQRCNPRRGHRDFSPKLCF